MTDEIAELVAKENYAMYERHLGVWSNMYGDTKASAQKYIARTKARLSELKLWRLSDKALKVTANMLLVPSLSYAPLLAQFEPEDLLAIDKMVIATIRKQCSLTRSDPAYTIFLGEKNYGRGLCSFLESILEAIARELEILLNGDDEESSASLLRLYAYVIRDDENYTFPNFVKNAVHFLARYGIFLRETQENDLVNRTLDELLICRINNSRSPKPIGITHEKKQDKGALMGKGDERHYNYALGGKYYRALLSSFDEFKDKHPHNKLTYINVTTPSKWRRIKARPRGVDPVDLSIAVVNALKQRDNDAKTMLSFYE